MSQLELSNRNQIAWNSNSYEAWVRQYGTPSEAAEKIRTNPSDKLRRVINYLPELQGLKIANPLGSHGRFATALALLGANVTVFDISESNAQYASELFIAANVEVDYIVGDFQSTAQACKKEFDVVVMELGIIHYFANLAAFVAAVHHLVPTEGLVILNEFHPILKKSISINTNDITLTGDYFSSTPEVAQTPYESYVEEDIPTCLIRRWNLGEVVSAFASGGFRIRQLVEHPSTEQKHLPGTFTLVATAC